MSLIHLIGSESAEPPQTIVEMTTEKVVHIEPVCLR